MKQLLSVCAGPLSALMAALALCAPLHRAVDAGIDPATDYGEAMIDAAAAGDEEAGRALLATYGAEGYWIYADGSTAWTEGCAPYFHS